MFTSGPLMSKPLTLEINGGQEHGFCFLVVIRFCEVSIVILTMSGRLGWVFVFILGVELRPHTLDKYSPLSFIPAVF